MFIHLLAKTSLRTATTPPGARHSSRKGNSAGKMVRLSRPDAPTFSHRLERLRAPLLWVSHAPRSFRRAAVAMQLCHVCTAGGPPRTQLCLGCASNGIVVLTRGSGGSRTVGRRVASTTRSRLRRISSRIGRMRDGRHRRPARVERRAPLAQRTDLLLAHTPSSIQSPLRRTLTGARWVSRRR